MQQRNVLVIAYYFPPMGLSGVQRTLKFVKYLPEFGWKPFVLTDEPSSFYAFDDTLLDELVDKDIEIFRTESSSKNKNDDAPYKQAKFPSHFIQKLGRIVYQTIYQPDRFIKWKNKAVALGEQIIANNSINVIYATAPPFTDFLIARELSEKCKIPFIVDYRDLWVDNPFNYFPTAYHKAKNIQMERDVLIHSHKAIVITRYAKEQLLRRYKLISHEDISIIPHGYDPDDFEPYKFITPDNNKFTITHSGVFQDNRTPKYFLKALSNYIKKQPEAGNNIEVRFIGIMRKNHLSLIKKYNLQNNVVVTDYLPHNESIKNLMESDVLWLMLNDTVRTPGKLYEYFGANKPLLISAPDGIMKKIALQSNAAIATNPKDLRAIEQAIATYYKLWKSNSLPTPKQEFVKQFNRRNLTEQLVRELSLASEV